MAFFKKFRDAQRPCCAALVAAAGSSSRMGGVNKLLQPWTAFLYWPGH